eukprot:989209-Pyramimonas_sp.AAC.1
MAPRTLWETLDPRSSARACGVDLTREPHSVGLALLGADLRLELNLVGGIVDRDLGDGRFAPGDPGAQGRRLEVADPLVPGGPRPEA